MMATAMLEGTLTPRMQAELSSWSETVQLGVITSIYFVWVCLLSRSIFE